ncbi:MAG: hypothetical protein JSS22_15670 [Proteobacteria bacterium]|nr:hypothetical protein [Pseudomonadota bacterium]
MKALSPIFALAFVVAAPSLAGSPDDHLPGIGTFAYNGVPVAKAPPQQIAALVREEQSGFRRQRN